MDWYQAIERFRLMHIVAMLFSLAAMADMAAGASPRRRRDAMAALLRGQAAGLRLLGLSDVPDAEVCLTGVSCNPDDARSLAVRLRFLALMVYYQYGLGDSFDGEPGFSGVSALKGQCFLVIAPSRYAGRDVPLIDTS